MSYEFNIEKCHFFENVRLFQNNCLVYLKSFFCIIKSYHNFSFFFVHVLKIFMFLSSRPYLSFNVVFKLVSSIKNRNLIVVDCYKTNKLNLNMIV